MLKYLLIICITFLFAACSGNDTKNETPPLVDSTALQPQPVAIGDAPYFWAADADSTGEINIRKVRPISADSLNYTAIIELLNSQYPEVKLEPVKLSGDTLHIKIADSRFLTNRMGSSGAFYYMQEVTYNLTELKEIGYIHFDFKEGNHAKGGTYHRSNFMPEKR